MLAHQIPVLLGGGLDPSVIFAEMPGAWLEPRQGSMWQENTGATATTSGGQTIGLLLGLDQQAQLGAELVTNGDFSNGTTGWSVYNSTIDATGNILTITSTTAQFGVSHLSSSFAVGGLYKFNFDIDYTNVSNANPVLRESFVVGGSAGLTATVVFSGNGNKTVYVLCTSAQTRFYIHTTPGSTGSFTLDNVSIKRVLGNHAYQATAANRPTLQYTNGLPIVRCDSNDFMTVSLPAINVRRNLLRYSEQFDNVVWERGQVSTTQTRITNTGTSSVFLYQSLSGINKTRCYYSIESKYVSARYAQLTICSGSSVRYAALFDLTTGQFVEQANSATPLTNTEYSITPTPDGYYRMSVAGERYDAGWYVVFQITNAYPVTRDSSLDISNATNGVSADIRNAYFSDYSDRNFRYQKITDWTSEKFSSSGSVYFALNTGMSALHNQSIGTSYSAPIQSMDLYGAVIVPSRLSDQREAQLQTYFEKLAGLR